MKKSFFAIAIFFMLGICWNAFPKENSKPNSSRNASHSNSKKHSEKQRGNSENPGKESEKNIPALPQDITIILESYPELNIKAIWDNEINDWLLNFSNYGKDYSFQFCNGRILPKEEAQNADSYWSLLYFYAKELRNPSTFTQEEIQKLKQSGLKSSRRNGKGTPMFFFDAVYDSFSKETIEPHIKTVEFLGKKTRIHEKIQLPLKKVEERILEAAKSDLEMKSFVEKIKSCDAYYWRLIDGTNRKSFHSLGISMDILPVRITGEIYWSWARDKNPDGWMITPLEKRWLPPKKAVDIFEQEGFIWGGKWAIWDNMHFEYHPELIFLRDKTF